MMTRIFSQILGRSSFGRVSLFSSVLASIALSLTAVPQALATSTMQYNCWATIFDEIHQTGFAYEFEALATQGSFGGPLVRPGSTLSVSKFYENTGSDDGFIESIVKNETLKFDGAGASWIAYSLGSSVHGLSLNFYPDANGGNGNILIFHSVNSDLTLVSTQEATQCTVSEVG